MIEYDNIEVGNIIRFCNIGHAFNNESEVDYYGIVVHKSDETDKVKIIWLNHKHYDADIIETYEISNRNFWSIIDTTNEVG